MVGDGPERLAAEQLCRAKGLTNKVKFLGKLRDVEKVLIISDVFVLPSSTESFGLVALEAQACGTPVVATAIGGLRTAVSDGISGSLVDGHDPKAWSAVISRLIMEPQRRLLLSMGAIEHASHFGWENTARKTLDVYDWALTKKNSSKLKLAEDA